MLREQVAVMQKEAAAKEVKLAAVLKAAASREADLEEVLYIKSSSSRMPTYADEC